MMENLLCCCQHGFKRSSAFFLRDVFWVALEFGADDGSIYPFGRILRFLFIQGISLAHFALKWAPVLPGFEHKKRTPSLSCEEEIIMQSRNMCSKTVQQ